MRFTMICIGSMGDVGPYITLGKELSTRGHKVTICAFSTFREKIESENLYFKPLAGDVMTFMTDIMAPGARGIVYLRQIRRTMLQILTPLLKTMEEACEDAEVIVTTFFGQIAQSFAEVKHIPFIQTHYFPMDKNSSTPISSMKNFRLGRIWNKFTYDLGYMLISSLEKYYLRDWRAAHNMSPRKIEGQPTYELNGHIIPVLYALSPLLFSRPANWRENIHITGFWRETKNIESFIPSTELTDFLNGGNKPPIYIGFGSMTGNEIEDTMSLVINSVEKSGVRAIISKGWGAVEIPKHPNIFVADYVPHDWLFKRVSAVVHHGGAGTTASGLTAGKPTLIIPFGGDQLFWGSRVEKLGLGPKPIRREKLTEENLISALIDLTDNSNYKVAAEEMGVLLSLENGVVKAADIIEDSLRKWLIDEGKTPDIS